MTYYLLVLLLLFDYIICFNNNGVLSVFQNQHPKNIKVFYLFAFFIMFLIMGLREDTVGVDTKNYSIIFDSVSKMSWNTVLSGKTGYSMETPYLGFMKLCSLLVDNYYFFQIIISAIYCFGMMHYYLSHFDNYPFTACVLFLGLGLFLEPFNITRQFVAVMLCMHSWFYLTCKKYYRFALFILFAIAIHHTALVFLFSSLIYAFRNNKWVLRCFLVIVVAVAAFFDRILPYASLLFPEYANYYKNNKVIHEAGLIWVVWILILVISCLFFWHYKGNKYELLMDNTFIVGIFSVSYVILNIVGLRFNYVERIGLYYLPFVAELFLMYTNIIHTNKIKNVYLVLLNSCFIIYFLISSSSAQYSYHTFLFR